MMSIGTTSTSPPAEAILKRTQSCCDSEALWAMFLETSGRRGRHGRERSAVGPQEEHGLE